MNEHSFVRSIHQVLPGEIMKWKIHDNFAGGVPDAWYCGKSKPLFVEYKYQKVPKKLDSRLKPNLSKLQELWFDKLISNAHSSWVVVGTDQGIVLIDNLASIKNGILVKNIKYLTKKEYIQKLLGEINNV